LFSAKKSLFSFFTVNSNRDYSYREDALDALVAMAGKKLRVQMTGGGQHF
jgi:hypothetical protein